MDGHQREKIRRFLSDKVMNQAVYDVLLRTFLKTRKNDDVHALAASRIAIDLLQDAWRELNKEKASDDDETERGSNPGL